MLLYSQHEARPTLNMCHHSATKKNVLQKGPETEKKVGIEPTAELLFCLREEFIMHS